MYVGLYVKYSIFVSDFNENELYPDIFEEKLVYKVS